MYKNSLLTALIIICFGVAQCTEDETIENAVYDSEINSVESGEEGDQELDNERD